MVQEKASSKGRIQDEQIQALEVEIQFIYSDEFESLTEEDVLTLDNERLYSEPSSRRSALGEMTNPARLLTAAGEAHLFRQFNFLRFLAEGLREKAASKRSKKSAISEIYRLLAKAGEARSAIVEANTRLVASIAHKFANSRFEYEDLVSEGNMILVNAVDKFDYSRGFRFSTYATHAIQRHFYRLMQRKQRRRTREVATPTDILADVAPAKEYERPLDHTVANALLERFGDCLDDREAVIIRERFGFNSDESSETLKVVAEKVGLSKERVRQLQMGAIEKLQDLAIKMNLRLEPSF